MSALRNVLEEDHQEDETDSLSPPMSNSDVNGQSTNDYDLIILPPGAIYVMPGSLNEPIPAIQAILHEVFYQSVAPMLKVFHIPTLRAFVDRGASYLGQSPDAPSNKAVKASLWWFAVLTMTDVDCQLQLGQARSDLMQRYKRIVDLRLAQADLINSNEMATLQAFLTTLVSNLIWLSWVRSLLTSNRLPCVSATTAAGLGR